MREKLYPADSGCVYSQDQTLGNLWQVRQQKWQTHLLGLSATRCMEAARVAHGHFGKAHDLRACLGHQAGEQVLCAASSHSPSCWRASERACLRVSGKSFQGNPTILYLEEGRQGTSRQPCSLLAGLPGTSTRRICPSQPSTDGEAAGEDDKGCRLGIRRVFEASGRGIGSGREAPSSP